MGNILGQPFEPFVTKQIKVRQESLGYKNYGNEDLISQQAKTPWIRLASTVDIQSEENGILQKLKSFGIAEENILGPKAARNLILQGGAVSLDPNNNFKQYSGLNDGSFYSGAYGWGGTGEKGFTPLPGIIDASLVYYNNGALSKAVINMKCFSRNQLALIDALYMRPGYNLLLEFGWSTYLDNNKRLQTHDSFQSPALELMLQESPSAEPPANFEIPRLVNKHREDTSGNYEGVFGKITNFKWEFNSDGSYNCQTTITGMGGVIEGLKMGSSAPSEETLELLGEKANKVAQAQIILENVEVKEAVEEANKKVTNAVNIYTKLDGVIDKLYADTSKRYGGSDDTYNDKGVDTRYFNKIMMNFPDPDNNFKKTNLVFKDAVLMHDEIVSDIEGVNNPTMYFQLGYFFALLQKDFLIYNEKDAPLFSFDFRFSAISDGTSDITVQDQNFIQNLPGQFSSNPLVCIAPYTPPDPVAYGAYAADQLADYNLMKNINKQPLFKVDSNPYVGRLAFIYVNYDYIKKLLKESKRNKDGTLPLLTFIQTMFDGISDALGGINKIEVFEDTSVNKIKFIENIPQNWSNVPPGAGNTKFCKLNTFGVKNNVEGSIVKNLSLNASISKEFASMISIGAQANGNQLNENATAFSNYNKGLIDRTFIEKNTESGGASNSVTSPAEKFKENNAQLQKIWDEQITNIKDTFTSKGGGTFRRGLAHEVYWQMNWQQDILDSLASVNKTWISLLQGIYSEIGKVQSSFFLPFKLSLDIEGISGIKLFQKFEVDDNVLPPSYAPNSVDIQIKAANHTVNNKEWTTKLETQSVPKPNISGEVVKSVNNSRKQKRRSYVQKDVAEIQEPTLETITSKYPITQIYFDTETPKTQLYLHHTVSGQNIQNVVDAWSKRTDRVSTHYVTNNNGEIEQLFEDEFWAYHLGVKRPTFAALRLPYQNLNRTSIGIELCSWGGLKAEYGLSSTEEYQDLQYINSVGDKVDSNSVTQAIDANGKKITYKGYKYFEKYSNTQINVVKGKLQELMSKYNIPFKYDYDVLFKEGNLSRAALSGEKGIYTHNSVRTNKSDVFPQEELIEMLKSISTS